MDDLRLQVEVIGVLLVLLALAAAAVLVRRRWLGHGVGAFDCSLRSVVRDHGKGWALGVARYEEDRIEWFRVFDLSPRPRRVLYRADIMVKDRRIPTGAEAYAVMAGFVIVSCRSGLAVVELAMSEQSCRGFASWLEAAPPGQTMSVA